eukprot:6481876-Amphidinium_carterae.1
MSHTISPEDGCTRPRKWTSSNDAESAPRFCNKSRRTEHGFIQTTLRDSRVQPLYQLQRSDPLTKCIHGIPLQHLVPLSPRVDERRKE